MILDRSFGHDRHCVPVSMAFDGVIPPGCSDAPVDFVLRPPGNVLGVGNTTHSPKFSPVEHSKRGLHARMLTYVQHR